jgi:DNA-binding MarR family transcriptional regulator
VVVDVATDFRGKSLRAQLQPVLSSVELEAWRAFLRSHAAIVRCLDAHLVAAHGLTLNDYEALIYLAQVQGRRLRMSELADRVLLTRSGVTRLVDGLERAGLVRRCACAADARGSFAELTQNGLAVLRAAGQTHLRGVRELFAERFSERELETLAELLARLPGADTGGACSAA